MYINVKRLKLHKVATYSPFFPCSETIKWILQCIDTESWLIRGHDGAPIAVISSVEISAYYRLPKKQEVFNTKWLVGFSTPTKDILREWWQDPTKFWVKTDQAYKTKGL